MIQDVLMFNRDVLCIEPRPLSLLSGEERRWLVSALMEEIDEYLEANDVAEAADALLDLIYFAIGGMYRMGMRQDHIEQAFLLVHTANLKKKLGIKETRPQDGSVADAVKSPDWTPPEEKIREMLHAL